MAKRKFTNENGIWYSEDYIIELKKKNTVLLELNKILGIRIEKLRKELKYIKENREKEKRNKC